MLKSKEIVEYFEANLADLVPGIPLTFDVYLYFSQNMHIVQWRSKGDILTREFIDKNRSRGIDKVWIHKEDTSTFVQYLNPAPPPKAAPPPESGKIKKLEGPQKRATKRIHTKQGEEMAETLNSVELTDEEKSAKLAKDAQAILSASATADDLESQSAANLLARKIVQDILETIKTENSEVAEEIWTLSNIDADFEHSVNVGAYATIFAMAFGQTDKLLIADLSLAGLLHDIGLSQIPAAVSSTPWRKMTDEQRKTYSAHVRQGIALINTYAPHTSDRTRSIIDQHHEKFDGSGYPQGLKGFKVDDLGQLLAMADVLDSIAVGRWDGIKRTYRDAIALLEEVEKVQTFPEYFNPEVFSTIIKWTRNPQSDDVTSATIKHLKKQAQRLIHHQID